MELFHPTEINGLLWSHLAIGIRDTSALHPIYGGEPSTSHLPKTKEWRSLENSKHEWWSRWWFQRVFMFTRIWGRFSILTNIFQRGWNYQLVMYTPVLKDSDFPVISSCKHCVLFPLLKNLCFFNSLKIGQNSWVWISGNLVVELMRWWSGDSPNLRSIELTYYCWWLKSCTSW